MIFADEGNTYLYWTTIWPETGNCTCQTISVQQIYFENGQMKFVDGTRKHHLGIPGHYPNGTPVPGHSDFQSWENSNYVYSINEGAFVFKRGGLYYLLYAGSSVEQRQYAEGYMTATDPLGPFTKCPQAQGNPILHATDCLQEHIVSGPGIACYVLSPDGKEEYILYSCHSNPNEQDGNSAASNRCICLDRIGFRDDGSLYVIGPTTTSQPDPSYEPVYDLALNRPASASSYFPGWPGPTPPAVPPCPPENAVDGSDDTAWASNLTQGQEWLDVDLGLRIEGFPYYEWDVNDVEILWYPGYHATDYDIQVAHNDSGTTSSYTTVGTVRGSKGGYQRHFAPTSAGIEAKHVRIKCLTPYTTGTYAIATLRANLAYTGNLAYQRPTTRSSCVDQQHDSDKVVDSSGDSSYWESSHVPSSSEYVRVDLGNTSQLLCQVVGFRVCWGDAYASTYSLCLSADADGSQEYQVVTITGNSTSSPRLHTLSKPVAARYVKLLCSGYGGAANYYSVRTLDVYCRVGSTRNPLRIANAASPTSGALATATTWYDSNTTAVCAIDNNPNTVWASAAGSSSPQSLSIDLGTTRTIKSCEVHWWYPSSPYYADVEELMASCDGQNYFTVFSHEASGWAEACILTGIPPVSAKLFKLKCSSNPARIYAIDTFRLFGE